MKTVIHGSIIVALLCIEAQAFAKNSSDLCIGGHCFEDTLEAFQDTLPPETDYEMQRMGANAFLILKDTVEINGKAFTAQYANVTRRGGKVKMLQYSYDYTPRSKTMCKDGFVKLLKTFEESHGPLNPAKKGKDRKNYSSEVIESDAGVSYRYIYDAAGKYKTSKSQRKITSKITLEIDAIEINSAMPALDIPAIPLCNYSVSFTKT